MDSPSCFTIGGDEKSFWVCNYRESDEQIEEVVDAMDWNFKEFSWQLSDLEQKENGDLGAVVEFGRLESQEKKIESLVDLKLTVADSKQGSLNKLKDGKGPILISSGSSKRKNATKKPSCLVDSCKSDLSNCREYYKRHRVCELHSKTPIVTVKGEEKRFCQQCSRFHSLGEFDEGKRSCRKRLDGHNRRRRKAQPEPFYWNFKNFMSSYKGPRILQFGSPHMYANPIVGNMWPFHTKTDADPSIYSDCNRFCVIDEQQGPANSLNGGSKFFLLQENDTKQGKTSGEFLCQPALNPNNPQGRGRGSHLLSSETATVPGRCALYLLSSNSNQDSGQSNETHSIQFQDSTDPNTSFSSLAEYPYLCPAKEQAWGPITNF